MRALSLYSGECDGLGLAAEWAGIEVAAYCEADRKRRARITEKHPGIPVFSNDEEVTADALHAAGIYPDILFGGPPCQPFSVAGARRAEADPRHRWPQMRRIIHECRPRWVVVENVGGFVHLALDIVLADLESEEYEAGAVVLPALAVGAPHRRDRCFVVGYTQRDPMRDDLSYIGTGSGEIDALAGAGWPVHVADSHGTRQSQRQEGEVGRWVEHGSAAVAHATIAEHDGRVPARNRRGGHSDGCIVEHTGCTGCEKCRPPAVAGGEGHAAGRPDPGKSAWTAQPGLGGVLDGISARLDKQMSRWPAWRGMESYSWEPPRTAVGVRERTRRIESLGLAVVPWQAYPIFALIAEIDRMTGGNKP